MNTFLTSLAQAPIPTEDVTGWGGIVALVILILVVCGILDAVTKKKEYDVRLGGSIRQR